MTDPPASRRDPSKKKRRKRRASTPSERPARRGASLSRAALWTVSLLLLALVGAAVYVVLVYPSRRGPGGGRDVELTIVGDESPQALSARLFAAGLIAQPRLFTAYLRLTGAAAHVARGAHLLTDDLSPREVMNRLERRGAAARVKVTIPEGFTRFDIGKRLHASHVCTQKAFVDATEDRALLADLHLDGSTAEGFLFPATYELPSDAEPGEVVRRLKAEFDKRWFSMEQRHPSGMVELSQSLAWGMREVVILASIIEKEAAVDDERRTIASVFLNRLRDPAFKRKVLQSDPTAGYGCVAMRDRLSRCANYSGRITADIVHDPDNPYSTYTHEGLPPGPICSPGARSLEAVMNPATTRYFFFVAKGEGRHTFSETYEAHVSAIHDGAHK